MGLVLPAGVAAFVAALALDNAGYFPHSWIWAAVVPAWVAAMAALFRDGLRLGRLELWWLGALAALTAWAAASASWSDVHAQSVLDARRDLVYVATALATAAILDRRRARLVPAAVHLALAVLLVVALGRYLAGGRRIDTYESTLLSWPIGYANGIGALAAIGIPLGLGLGAHARSGRARASAAAALAPFLAALVLSSSRGGVVGAVAAVAVLVWLDPRRRAIVRLLALGAAPAALVVAACLASRLTSATVAPGHDGGRRAVATVAVLAGGAVLALCGARSPRVVRGRLPGPAPVALVPGAAAAVAAVVSALPRLGGAGLLRHTVGKQRADYWDVAWRQVAARPFAGTGAGTFGRRWLLAGAPQGSALDAHNLYLETLGELGAAGLVLLAAALAAPLAAARRAAGASRLGAATAAGYTAFLVHALVDWDWELPAVTCAAFVLAGSLLALARRPARTYALGRSGRAALAVAAIAVAVLALLGVGRRTVPSAAAAAAAAARGIDFVPAD